MKKLSDSLITARGLNLLDAFRTRFIPKQVKFSSVDTRRLPDDKQFDFWQQSMANVGVIERPDTSNAPFYGMMTNYFTSSLGFSHYKVLQHCSLDRNQKIVDESGIEGIAVQYRLKGREVANSFDHGQFFTEGTVRIVNMNRPFFSENTMHENLAIAVTQKQLMDRLPGLGRLHGVMLPDNPMTDFLKAHMASVLETLPKVNQLEAEKMSEVTLEMLAATLLSLKVPGILESDSMDTAFMRTVRLCIEKHLHLPDLGPELIAREVGVSRAKLFRKCQPFCSPMELVQFRRMRRAMEIMKSDPKVAVADVAFRVGFDNRETFSRHFRKEFGFSARDFVQSYHLGRDGL